MPKLKQTYWQRLYTLHVINDSDSSVMKSCPTLGTPWTVDRQAPLSMGFSRQEYWSRLPFPSTGDLPNSGTEPRSPALQADSLPTELLLETADLLMGFPGGISGKEPTYQCRRLKRPTFHPYVGKMPWWRAWQPTPVFLPGEFHGERSLVGYSPWGHKELGTTEVT